MLRVEQGLSYLTRVIDDGDRLVPATDIAHPEVIDNAVDELIQLVLDRVGWVALVDDGALAAHGGVALERLKPRCARAMAQVDGVLSWTFLTNRAHVLPAVTRTPGCARSPTPYGSPSGRYSHAGRSRGRRVGKRPSPATHRARCRIGCAWDEPGHARQSLIPEANALSQVHRIPMRCPGPRDSA